jgi:hypothetical protein
MQHIDAAELHEYLDRGPADDRLARIEAHISDCDVCSARLATADAERYATASILDAAAPLPRPIPLFETLVPKPRYETFEMPVPTDVSFPKEHGQFREASIGMRGQAIMFAWTATIVLAVGLGWFASTVYRVDKTALPPLLAVAWTAIPSDSALSFAGGPIPIVDGATIIGYARGAVGETKLVRVQHRTATGAIIDVIQPFAADTASATAPNISTAGGPMGDRYVRVVEWNGRRITVIAPDAAAAGAVTLSSLPDAGAPRSTGAPQR